VVDLFKTDARSNLIGERPLANVGNSNVPEVIDTGDTGDAPQSAGGFAWSKLVSGETLIDEIKAYQTPLAEGVKTPSGFKGGAYKDARKYFSMLAVMFAIIAESDEDIRWKSQAIGARELFARAGFNCKVGTDQSFNEAKLRSEDLAALVRGEQIQPPANIEPKTKWDKVANRPPLMMRLELAQQERLAKWTSSDGDFSANADAVYRESQIVAALAEVIQREEFEFADDSNYQKYAEEMQKAALDIAEAAKSKNYPAARTAAGNMAKSCSNCHGDFRS
jgi:hypothetical protein